MEFLFDGHLDNKDKEPWHPSDCPCPGSSQSILPPSAAQRHSPRYKRTVSRWEDHDPQSCLDALYSSCSRYREGQANETFQPLTFNIQPHSACTFQLTTGCHPFRIHTATTPNLALSSAFRDNDVYNPPLAIRPESLRRRA